MIENELIPLFSCADDMGTVPYNNRTELSKLIYMFNKDILLLSFLLIGTHLTLFLRYFFITEINKFEKPEKS